MNPSIISEVRSITGNLSLSFEESINLFSIYFHPENKLSEQEHFYISSVIKSGAWPFCHDATGSFLIIEDQNESIFSYRHDGLYSRATLEFHHEQQEELDNILPDLVKDFEVQRPSPHLFQKGMINPNRNAVDVLYIRGDVSKFPKWDRVLSFMHTSSFCFDYEICSKWSRLDRRIVYRSVSSHCLGFPVVFVESNIVKSLFSKSTIFLQEIEVPFKRWWKSTAWQEAAKDAVWKYAKHSFYDEENDQIVFDDGVTMETFQSISDLNERLIDVYELSFLLAVPREEGIPIQEVIHSETEVFMVMGRIAEELRMDGIWLDELARNDL